MKTLEILAQTVEDVKVVKIVYKKKRENKQL